MAWNGITNVSPERAWAAIINAHDIVNDALRVTITADDVGIGGGTQYTEGDTDATIVGTAILWEDSGDTLIPVSESKPLPVLDTEMGDTVITSGSGTITKAVTIAGRTNGTNVPFIVEVAGAAGDDIAATAIGFYTNSRLMGYDGTTWDRIRGTSTDGLLVNLGSNNDVRISDGTDIADVLDLTNSNPLTVAIVDGSGDQITSFGGGTQHATNDAYADTDIGTLAITVRDDALTTLTEADGDFSTLRVGSTGALWTQISGTVTVDGSGVTQPISAASLPLPTGAATSANQSTIIGHVDGIEALLGTIDTDTSGIITAVQLIDDAIYVDDADWTDGTSKHMLVGGLYQSSPQSITDGDVGPLSLTSDGALRVSGGGGGTEYTEDAATPAAIVGTATMMERDDALATVTPVEGDWIGFRGTAEGALWTQDFNSDAILADTNAMVVDLAAIETLLGTIDADTSTLAGTDFMLGTDFSAVLGAASLVIATQADDIANTQDTLATTAFLQLFDGTTWDRARGDSANGLLVNLGANNDITGTVTAELSAVDNAVLDQIELNQDSQTALLTTIDADTSAIAVDAAAIEALLTTIDSDTGGILTAVQTIDNAIDGSEMQVDVITMPVVSVEPDGTALSNNQVSVDTTSGGVTILAASAGRHGAIVSNDGSVDCYIGTGTVSSTNGLLLRAGESVPVPTDSDIKGITAASSTTVSYLAFA